MNPDSITFCPCNISMRPSHRPITSLKVYLNFLAGVAIGSIVLLGAIFAGPISGASMNPARSLAPALVSGNLHHLWIYLLAPFIGAGISVMACKGVKEKNCCPQPSVFCKTSRN